MELLKKEATFSTKYASTPSASNKKGVYREADFGLLDRFTKSTNIPNNIDELKNSNVVTDGKAGSMIGRAVGGYAGTLAGASYNPDIIDEGTGETRKMGLLPRVALVAGSRALGGTAGAGIGGLTGGSVGLLRPKTPPVPPVAEYSANFASWKGQAAASMLSDNPFEVISDLKEAARLRDSVKGVIPNNMQAPTPGTFDRITGDIGTNLGALGAATGAGIKNLGTRAADLGESMKSDGMDVVLDGEAGRKLGRNVLAGTGLATIGTGLGVNAMLKNRQAPIVEEVLPEEAMGAFKSTHRKYAQFTWN